jgi:uncharacterized protein (DUF1697 family)
MTTAGMTTYVALLRGINLGGRNRLPMATLRELIEGMGGTGVRTLLQSGNAVFEHAEEAAGELAGRLEELIRQECGLRVPCVVRELADLRRVVEGNPFAGTGFEPAKLVVTFLSGPVTAEQVAGVDPALYVPDEFRLGEREVYINCPTGLARSKLPTALGNKLAKQVATARNWNTVTKLAEMSDN